MAFQYNNIYIVAAAAAAAADLWSGQSANTSFQKMF
jgi:hypothetical protein